MFVVILGGALAGLVIRYRSGTIQTRQQIKWIVLIVLAGLVLQAVALLALAANHGRSSLAVSVAYTIMPAIALFGTPAVITLAILKHGLYQIDVIISRAVQYGLLSAVLTGVYVAIVIGVGTLAGYSGGGSGLSVAAAVAVALLFQPVRQRAQRVANRFVYGERASPYQVLADLAEDMGGQLDAGRCSTGWRRCWPGPLARSRSGSGSAWAASCGRGWSGRGRRTAAGPPRRYRWHQAAGLVRGRAGCRTGAG